MRSCGACLLAYLPAVPASGNAWMGLLCQPRWMASVGVLPAPRLGEPRTRERSTANQSCDVGHVTLRMFCHIDGVPLVTSRGAGADVGASLQGSTTCRGPAA